MLPAEASECWIVAVEDAGRGKRFRQRCSCEVRVSPAPGKAAHIRQTRYGLASQEIHELLPRTVGVSDGVDSRQGQGAPAFHQGGRR